MFGISLHMEWPLTSESHGSVSQREQVVGFDFSYIFPAENQVSGEISSFLFPGKIQKGFRGYMLWFKKKIFLPKNLKNIWRFYLKILLFLTKWSWHWFSRKSLIFSANSLNSVVLSWIPEAGS
jgi:hypothetical protein